MLPQLDSRIPNWDRQSMMDRCCPICNTFEKDIAFERPDQLFIRMCKKCHIYFVSPSPSYEQLKTFYLKYDEMHRIAPKMNMKKLLNNYENSDPFDDIRIREMSSLMKFDNSKVLDIGFGRAYLLYCLKRLGAIPLGLDLDTQAIKLAKYLGIEAIRSDIDNFLCEKKFDLITMIDLVEHPLNPMETLTKSSELLSAGGYLLIWTPNGNYGLFERHPVTFRVDLEHMQYFTPETCHYIANYLNMNVIHLETLGYPSLENMPQNSSKNRTIGFKLKKIIRSIPGFYMINEYRNIILRNIQIKNMEHCQRMGSYHLFCILQKPVQN